MSSKLRGSRLEAEIDKCRGECNWTRMEDLLPLIKAKGSGVEKSAALYEGEMYLETFILSSDEKIEPKIDNAVPLTTTNHTLRISVACLKNDLNQLMEARILLAKLHYISANFNEALSCIENSQLDNAKTQFTSLRALKLAAEGYAIKGLALERIKHANGSSAAETTGLVTQKQIRVINCFEKSAELSLSYIAELEKMISSSAQKLSGSSVQTVASPKNVQIGFLLESVLERMPYMLMRRKKAENEGLEWYRKITTVLGDKYGVFKFQQKFCLQLALILMRGMIDVGYDSHAISSKSASLHFYTGSNKNFFAPSSKQEEIILLLLISEQLALKNLKYVDRLEESVSGTRALNEVQNALAVQLPSVRQFRMLSSVYEHGLRYADKDNFTWAQYGLALMAAGKFARAGKVFERCNKTTDPTDTPGGVVTVTQCLLAAKNYYENLCDYDSAMVHAQIALKLSNDGWQSARCLLLYGLAFSQKINCMSSVISRKTYYKQSLTYFERAIELDPHDELAHLFAACEYAKCRDLSKAKEYCQRSLEINDEQPSAIMLLALIYTARGDFKSALNLVHTALSDFPNHYGLLVLKLKLEAKFNRVNDVLTTSKDLLTFWRKLPFNFYHVVEDEGDISVIGHTNGLMKDKTLDSSTINTRLSSKDAMAPIFPGSVSMAAASYVSLANSSAELNESSSNAIAASEYGGAASTISGSLGILSSGSIHNNISTTFRIQANIWVELAEFFIEQDRISEVDTCIAEAMHFFNDSFDVLFVYTRALIAKAKNVSNQTLGAQYISDAKSCLRALLASNPAHIRSLSLLAEIYQSEGNYVLAEKAYRDLVNMLPMEHEYWYNLGVVYAKQNRFADGQSCFETAAKCQNSTPIMPFDTVPRIFCSANVI